MKQVASLKICVLGGRSFGKTSLLSSLIAISGTKDAGISTLGDNQRKLDIYNDYKEGHGKLSATSWDDICQFRYKITGNEKRRWVVSFIDYPGEFFQDFFVDEKSGGLFNGVLAKLKSPGRDGKTQKEKNEDLSHGEKEKKIKAIVKEILSADALIVLLPADCERTEYKNLLSTFKTRLEALLQVIEARNPHIPVCLAINKYDMLGNTAIEDLLERPVFAGFHNMLSRERGPDYFYQPVSAFGGNKANGLPPETENIEDLRQTWDGKSEPQNVLPMLIKISEMAEEGRYKLLRERFDKASIVAKTLKWPFSWFHVRGLGANKEEDRKYCVTNLLRCAVRLGIFTLISAFSAFCAISTVCSLDAWICLSGYEKNLYSAEQSCNGDKQFILSKAVIKGLNEDRPRQLGSLVFFCKDKMKKLKERYEKLEDERNWRVFSTVRQECQGATLCDGGDDMKVEERLRRFGARIDRYQNAINEIFGLETRIGTIGANETLVARGTDNLLVGEKLNQIIADEIKNKDDLEGDKPFYLDREKVYSSNREDFCKEAEKFLQKYQSVKEHLKDKCDQVKNDLETCEKKLTSDADAYLKGHADDPNSENYQERISFAESRIRKVEELLKQVSANLPGKKKYEDIKDSDRELVNDLNSDKPFYEALKKLREDNTNIATGKVRRIWAFLEQNKQYDRCEKFMVPLRGEYSNELSRIQSECLHTVTNNYVSDNQSTGEKIKRTKNQIAAYQIAYNEYVIGRDEFLKAEKKIKELQERLKEYEKRKAVEDGFAADLKRVDEYEEGAFCREAEQVLEKYAEYCEWFKDQYVKLEKDKREREEIARGKIQGYLDTHKDDVDSEDCQNRIRQAKNRIAKIDSFIETIGWKSSFRSQYLDLKFADETLVRNLESDEPFYKALAALHKQNQKEANGKIRRNDAFLKAYKDYPRCKKFWMSVCEDLSNEVRRVQNECWTVVTKNSFNLPAISTGKKIERIKNQITAYEKAREEYVIGSVDYRDAEERIEQLNEELGVAQKMNRCETALNEIKGSSYSGRLSALNKFRSEYREILTGDQLAEADRLERDALQHWQDYQSTNEWRYAINEDDPLHVQKQKADALETVYSTLMKEFLPNSPHYTLLEQKKQELGDRKLAIKRDQELENAFRALPSTNAVERCELLNAIDVFESTYHVADYTSQHAIRVFDQLKLMKDEAQHAFWSDYTNQISKVQRSPETNFLGRCQWADACKKISEESYKGLGSNNVIRLRLEAEHEGYEEQYRRFAQLYGLASRANEIVSKSPTNDVRVACDRLSEIKKFYSLYPLEANQDPLVGEDYLKVKNAQEGNEEVISQYLEKELSKMGDELPLYGAPEEKKLEIWKKEIDLLGEYIPKFVEGSRPHTVYQHRLADLNSQFTDTQRKDLFDKDDKKLRAEIESEQDLERKLQKIREHLLGKYDNNPLYNFARAKIQEWKNYAGRIEKEIKFIELKGDLDKVVENRPAEGADNNKFDEFTANIKSLKERLGEFKQISHLEKKYKDADKKIQEQLEYLNKALGDGSWKAIQDREEEYKNNPCEKTEKKLRAALDDFDEKRFGKYSDSKKETEKRFNRDMELRNKLSSSKVAFFDNPSYSTFVVFKKAVETCLEWETGETPQGKAPQRGEPYGCKWPFVGICSSYISRIEKGIQVTLVVESVDFTGSWKTVDIRVAKKPVCKLYKVKGLDTHKFEDVEVGFDGLCFNVMYENTAAYQEVSNTLSFWKLLKYGARSGNCNIALPFLVIEKMWGCDPKEHTGTIHLSIQGIPYMP